jgi:hypothetical protein
VVVENILFEVAHSIDQVVAVEDNSLLVLRVAGNNLVVVGDSCLRQLVLDTLVYLKIIHEKILDHINKIIIKFESKLTVDCVDWMNRHCISYNNNSPLNTLMVNKSNKYPNHHHHRYHNSTLLLLLLLFL